MIKYAHRGLVKDGKLPSVFYKLYLLISVVFYSLWLLLALIGFLFSHSDSLEEKVLKTFKGERNVEKEISVHRYWQYFATSMFIFLMLLLIMSMGIFYSKRNSRHQCNVTFVKMFSLSIQQCSGDLHISDCSYPFM